MQQQRCEQVAGMNIVATGTLIETWCLLGWLKAGWQESQRNRCLNAFDCARNLHHTLRTYLASPPPAHRSCGTSWRAKEVHERESEGGGGRDRTHRQGRAYLWCIMTEKEAADNTMPLYREMLAVPLDKEGQTGPCFPLEAMGIDKTMLYHGTSWYKQFSQLKNARAQ
eukprot:1140637-Pelagomonas_calceolata.AAC.1